MAAQLGKFTENPGRNVHSGWTLRCDLKPDCPHCWGKASSVTARSMLQRPHITSHTPARTGSALATSRGPGKTQGEGQGSCRARA